ncbi:hypothetical protein ALC56_11673, partial [Trachymyrmex septentrionalis]
EWHDSIITNVLYVPNLSRNLFFEGVTKKGMIIVKENNRSNIYENNELITVAKCKENNLYHMQFKSILSQEVNVVVKDSLRK